MLSLRRRAPRRLAGGALLLAVLVGGCSADDPAADASRGAETSDAGSSGSSGSQPEAAGSDESAPLSASLGSLGSALERTLGGMEGYEVDGTTLTIRFDDTITAADVPTACSMVRNLAGSLTLPPDSTAQVVIDGATTDCEI